jgi:hypothetical protein
LRRPHGSVEPRALITVIAEQGETQNGTRKGTRRLGRFPIGNPAKKSHAARIRIRHEAGRDVAGPDEAKMRIVVVKIRVGGHPKAILEIVKSQPAMVA